MVREEDVEVAHHVVPCPDPKLTALLVVEQRTLSHSPSLPDFLRQLLFPRQLRQLPYIAALCQVANLLELGSAEVAWRTPVTTVDIIL